MNIAPGRVLDGSSGGAGFPASLQRLWAEIGPERQIPSGREEAHGPNSASEDVKSGKEGRFSKVSERRKGKS